MSHPTQRKSRHRHQPSGGGARTMAASDYESDAARYMTGPAQAELPPPPPLLAHRTNTELNLSVLRRYLPSIRSIVSIAANAAVYNFAPATGTWERSNVEGTLFVCEQEPVKDLAGQPLPRACVFVLNRHSLDNLVIHLCNTTVCEVVGELINFYIQDTDDSGTGQDTRVIGLWIHADHENTRKVNADAILALWRQSRLAPSSTGNVLDSQEDEAEGGADTGRRLSMTELFGQTNGASRR
jgi:Dcp1-like decapping family protein